ncbi:GNAT family N-acetyltransferase [Pullulanibacillus sp. KACC 23026]|uniref:GNAT family N-acetyltransferase n=1 Tax=Pullulanibacillus sp. KACC 23026 TaxID=3028315 RepID=UPI0023AE8366|nr:GNAT family N-acetyltransferase [Pullulanibacillus sp. KACC 23026]WEG12952.1 GNAT family N-acetyltransferase [Pullulanibacillus sp. KACC 23026]
MSRLIKKIPLEDIPRLVELLNGAYPGIASYDEKSISVTVDQFQSMQESDPSLNFYGYYNDQELIGAMRLHHFVMNLYGKRHPVGGVGFVGVDLLHKKEKVAKELLTSFINHFNQKQCPLTLLYPFRPDFYKKMGFGYGTKMSRYRIKPTAFHDYKNKSRLSFLKQVDQPLVKACYTRFFSEHHGMIEKSESEYKQLLSRPGHYVIGYEENGELLGYFSFSFKKAHETNTMINDLQVEELIYNHPDALKAFSTFFHSQADQVNRVVIHTQDEDFHFFLNDPRNDTDEVIPHVYHEAHTSGVGLMYRVTNIPLLLNQLSYRRFGHVTCRLKLTIQDRFYPENETNTYVQVIDGFIKKAALGEGPFDVALSLNVSDFSSLIMGSVPFHHLFRYGLINVSDSSYLPILNEMFFVQDKPICRTGF